MGFFFYKKIGQILEHEGSLAAKLDVSPCLVAALDVWFMRKIKGLSQALTGDPIRASAGFDSSSQRLLRLRSPLPTVPQEILKLDCTRTLGFGCLTSLTGQWLTQILSPRFLRIPHATSRGARSPNRRRGRRWVRRLYATVPLPAALSPII